MIKVGIIGCGKIAVVRHAPEYNENPYCKLTAFYNPTKEKAENLAALYGGEVYESIDALLNSDVDAVSVCVPNVYHEQVSIAALNAGKHVLCEKPMALSKDGCLAMLDAQEKSKKILMIALNQRYAETHKKARAILQSGALGNLLSFEMHLMHAGPDNWTNNAGTWYFEKGKTAIGAMADLGVHKTDLLYFLTGKKIVKTYALVSTVDKKLENGEFIEVDDNAVAIYTNEDGISGTVQFSWTNYGRSDFSTKLFCQGGVIRMYDDPDYSLIIEKNDNTVEKYTLDVLPSKINDSANRKKTSGVIDAFIDSIITGVQPNASGRDAMHAMNVIFANEESVKNKMPVLIKED